MWNGGDQWFSINFIIYFFYIVCSAIKYSKKSIIFPSEKGISSHQRIEPYVPSINKTGYPQKE